MSEEPKKPKYRGPYKTKLSESFRAHRQWMSERESTESKDLRPGEIGHGDEFAGHWVADRVGPDGKVEKIRVGPVSPKQKKEHWRPHEEGSIRGENKPRHIIAYRQLIISIIAEKFIQGLRSKKSRKWFEDPESEYWDFADNLGLVRGGRAVQPDWDQYKTNKRLAYDIKRTRKKMSIEGRDHQ